ncbi:MAG TPA: radical SAM protein [Thermoanaerobaculia bacterium]
MDANRWSNILRLDRDYAAGKDRLSARPLEAYIEVAARCNLRCQMCPITVDPRYDPGVGLPGLLSREMFDRLEPIFPTLNRAYLFGLGEPVLHPDLVEFTERLASVGVEVWITTNGTLVTEEHAEALALAGLAHVTVSIDGATQETYERIRRRGRFEDVVRGLRALGAARRRHGRPELFLSLIGMASNLHEVPQLVELCAEVGGDGVFIEGLYPYAHPTIEEFYRRENIGHLEPGRIEELLAEGRRRADALGVQWVTRMEEQTMHASELDMAPPPAAIELDAPSVPAEELTLPWACSEPWQTINVNASGEVRPCCFNDDVLGSLATHGIDEIWNGEEYASLRRDQASGKVSPGCETCVRNGRVKQAPFLFPRTEEAAAGQGLHGLVVELPGEGELISDPVVIVGRRAQASRWRRTELEREQLPEIWVDRVRAGWIGDFALIDRDWFAAVIPIFYVSEGAHRVSFRPRGGVEEESWGARYVQRGEVTGGRNALVAVSRLAVPVKLWQYEPTPSLRIGGRISPVDHWLCGPHGDNWMGVAVIDVGEVPPGSWDFELRFDHHPSYRNRLEKLAAPLKDIPGVPHPLQAVAHL